MFEWLSDSTRILGLRKIIANYNLENSPWFMLLCKLRSKWRPALSKDFFLAGILSSRRSKSTKNLIGFKENKITSLSKFYWSCNSMVKCWMSPKELAKFQHSRSEPCFV